MKPTMAPPMANTIGLYPLLARVQVPNAEANLTMSTGVNPAPGFPPIVPLIPEIDFINATTYFLDSKYRSRKSIFGTKIGDNNQQNFK